MVKIRLTRTGRKNLVSYRIVAIDSNAKRESKSLEILGNYSPYTKLINLEAERIKYWLSVGAQPTETVHMLLVNKGLVEKSTKVKAKYTDKPGRKSKERAAAKASK